MASRAGTLPAPAPPPAGPTQVTATTDANGNYQFNGLATGTYTVTVSRPGFQGQSKEIQVTSSAARYDVALVGDSVAAQGLVSAPDGKPISGAVLDFCCINGYFSATTGADGRFNVAVQAGYWSVNFAAPGFQSQYQSLLVDGSDLSLQMQPIPPQDGRIAGTVLDSAGQPVAGARISLYNYGGCCYAYSEDMAMGAPQSTSSMPSSPVYSGENSTMTNAQGRYSIGAYSGQNQLSISKDGYAGQYRTVTVASGPATTIDIQLLKFPDKTAHITGQIVDAKTGKGVPYAYISVQSPQFGMYECSQTSSSGAGSTGSGGATTEGKAMTIAPGEPYPYPGCAITMQADGRFSGNVTPGYSVISVYVDSYASCNESRDADGSTQRSCGPEYYSWSISRDIAASASTTLDVRLRSRPAPDATVSGYILDSESGKAIAGAQISFSNQDNYGYGYATTDADGSYSLRLRSGYHAVSVWAEGHLRWEGVLDVPKGSLPFDVTVQPGNESYGGCCPGPYYGRGEIAYASADSSGGKSSGVTTAPSGIQSSQQTSSSSQDYEDLGGGLGPYDANKRNAQLEQTSDGAPGPGLIALLAALGAVLVVRRRLQP